MNARIGNQGAVKQVACQRTEPWIVPGLGVRARRRHDGMIIMIDDCETQNLGLVRMLQHIICV